MPGFDADIGWADSQAMVLCTCTHYYRSHRPISRKCSICECQHFAAQDPSKDPVVTPAAR